MSATPIRFKVWVCVEDLELGEDLELDCDLPVSLGEFETAEEAVRFAHSLEATPTKDN